MKYFNEICSRPKEEYADGGGKEGGGGVGGGVCMSLSRTGPLYFC